MVKYELCTAGCWASVSKELKHIFPSLNISVSYFLLLAATRWTQMEFSSVSPSVILIECFCLFAEATYDFLRNTEKILEMLYGSDVMNWFLFDLICVSMLVYFTENPDGCRALLENLENAKITIFPTKSSAKILMIFSEQLRESSTFLKNLLSLSLLSNFSNKRFSGRPQSHHALSQQQLQQLQKSS